MGSCENIPFHGELQKIRLIANNMGYGPLPAPDEEVEQRLTMTREGKVWLSRYSFHDTMRNRLMSRKQFSVDSDVWNPCLSRFPLTLPRTNLSVWQLMYQFGIWSCLTQRAKFFVIQGPCYEKFHPFLDVISDKLRLRLDERTSVCLRW